MSVEFKTYRPKVESALQQAIDRALEIIGGKAESYAKLRCPTKTSRLKNSITHVQEDEKTEVIGTNVKYAPFVELGHHQEVGRYVPAIGKRLVKDWVEPHAFLRPAMENHRDEYNHVLQVEIQKISS